MNMKAKSWLYLLSVCCLICFEHSTQAGDVSFVLICQLRVAKSVSPDPKTTRIDVATDSGEDGHFLWGYNQKVQKEDGSYLIFEPDDFLLFTASRRAVIVDDRSKPAQVFRLSLPHKPKVQDWSQWQRPDFLARGDVGWGFIYNQKIQSVITNIPSDSFELRYKVETRNFGH